MSLLEKITLPSLLNQTYKDFKWIILIDKRLPFIIKKKIEFLANKYSFIFFKYHNKEDISELNYYNEFLNKNNKYIITLRLDADDAIRYNFINKLKNIAIINLYKLDIGCICFNDVIILTLVNNNYYLRKCHRLSHAQGIALFSKKSIFNKNIFFSAHNEMKHNLKSFNKKSFFFQIDTNQPFYIRTVHNYNDSDSDMVYYSDCNKNNLEYFNLKL